MKLFENLLLSKDGKQFRADVECHYRNESSKEPSLHIIIWNKKRYTPYAAKKQNIFLTVGAIMHIIYDRSLAGLTYKQNPFFNLRGEFDV